jgi:NAD(P)H-hydrate epimerase
MPELMTTTWDAGIEGRNVLAIGPGLGQEPAARTLVEQYFETTALPMVVDADALNILAGTKFHAAGRVRILTPHPGEMGRLTGTNATAVQADRVNVARAFAQERGCIVVLKGQRTVIAMPDGKVFINPTGTPAMATAGSGDVLTGLIAGLLGQFPNEPEEAVLAAVWLHGRSGEIGAAEIGEQSFVAMELLHYLPTAMRELASVS